MEISANRQFARASVDLGRAIKLHAEANLTPSGIWAITALVSGILLSTSVLVAISIREGRRAKHQHAVDESSGARPTLPDGNGRPAGDADLPAD